MECDVVASTIFVNPTQFAPGDDLDAYPRTFDKDVETMTEAEVSAVFAPAVEELYPASTDAFTVVPPASFGELAEAAARPGHFSGVATVCTKLFNIIQPSIAFFGQKDALQCVAFRRFVHDF